MAKKRRRRGNLFVPPFLEEKALFLFMVGCATSAHFPSLRRLTEVCPREHYGMDSLSFSSRLLVCTAIISLLRSRSRECVSVLMVLDIIPLQMDCNSLSRLSAGEKHRGLFVLQNDKGWGRRGKENLFLIPNGAQAMMRSDVKEILVMAHSLDPPEIQETTLHAVSLFHAIFVLYGVCCYDK
jgi:hypothetical protein